METLKVEGEFAERYVALLQVWPAGTRRHHVPYYHAVNRETMGGRCGRWPKNSSSWGPEGEFVTCPGCIKRLQNLDRRTPTMETWVSMRDRCTKPTHAKWKVYGGRGITVCDRWLGPDGFANFQADMGERPSRKHSIDRIDGTKGYFPGNCRWATPSVQLRNRACLRRYEAFGKAQLPIEWAEEYGINLRLIHSRIKNGWSMEKILTTPKGPSNAEQRAKLRQ